MKRHVLVGAAAALLLLAAYVGIVSVAGGLEQALAQASSLWYWLLALALGIGLQSGLLSFVRHGLREQRRAATAATAASGGVSTLSMAACCAHHLGDVLPLLGVASVAAFFVHYQVLFIVLGLLSNAVGITMLLAVMQRSGLSGRLARLGWDLRWVRNGAMAASPLVLLATYFAVS